MQETPLPIVGDLKYIKATVQKYKDCGQEVQCRCRQVGAAGEGYQVLYVTRRLGQDEKELYITAAIPAAVERIVVKLGESRCNVHVFKSNENQVGRQVMELLGRSNRGQSKRGSKDMMKDDMKKLGLKVEDGEHLRISKETIH